MIFVMMLVAIGHATGGYQGGLLYGYTGNYTAAYALTAVAGILSLVSGLYRKTCSGMCVPQIQRFPEAA